MILKVRIIKNIFCRAYCTPPPSAGRLRCFLRLRVDSCTSLYSRRCAWRLIGDGCIRSACTLFLNSRAEATDDFTKSATAVLSPERTKIVSIRPTFGRRGYDRGQRVKRVHVRVIRTCGQFKNVRSPKSADDTRYALKYLSRSC